MKSFVSTTMFVLVFGRILFLPATIILAFNNNNNNKNNNGDDRSTISRTMIQSSSYDNRGTLSRTEAKDVYNRFADKDDTVGGNDAVSGYGGPAIKALLAMAEFDTAHVQSVIEYGCGQGKLVELVFSKLQQQQQQQRDSDTVDTTTTNNNNEINMNNNTLSLTWRGIDQSPKMIDKFLKRNNNGGRNSNNNNNFGLRYCTGELLESGNPDDVVVRQNNDHRYYYDRFVSTYCLDLLSEEDMYKVLDLAETCLDPHHGRLLLAGITWGYPATFFPSRRAGRESDDDNYRPSSNIQTICMTAIWEMLYTINRKIVGGCRPQYLRPYLESKGWTIERIEYTLPNGYPWMSSEVICARPPVPSSKK